MCKEAGTFGFDENDAYDDGYDTGDAVGVSGVEDAMYQLNIFERKIV